MNEGQGKMKEHIPSGLRVILAGGGTGGHLFPGLAIGREIVHRYKGSEVLFVTGRRKIESDILINSEFRQSAICIEGLMKRGLIKGLMVISMFPFSLLQSIFIIRRLSPDIVIGVGGYSAGPVCLAARLMRVATAIHEQNSFPGLTNRLLCRVVDRVFISFEQSRNFFPGGNIIFTGNPIRRELLEKQEDNHRDREKFTVLITGGSQGASATNSAVIDALGVMSGRKGRLRLIHQTGEADYLRVKDAYEGSGFQYEVTPFIKDIAFAYHQADIVVARAGATTISELAALGKPSILIPFPYAANDHQLTNARMLSDIGGAEIILQADLNGERLAALLMKYMDDKDALKYMGEQVLRVGRPNAVNKIMDQLEDMVGR
jgi:UDP-N-acetylglucosamine--N-acetylmuramyl-(pentapeptide) pyrophosphoryl-undecaprenol N-acetylglucosamine transferase